MSLSGACTLNSAAGPPFSQALAYDYSFDDTSCSAWTATGDAVLNGADAVFDGPGEVYQDVVVDQAYSSYALWFSVTINGSSPGLERLRIEIANTSGTILETVDVLSGSDSDGDYYFDTSDYDNQTVRIRIRRLSTNFAGDTEFVVHWAGFWGRF